MTREPSVFPVAPATVFPADSKPGVPDGLCDQRSAAMSTSPEEATAKKSPEDVIAKVLYNEESDNGQDMSTFTVDDFWPAAREVLLALVAHGYKVTEELAQ